MRRLAVASGLVVLLTCSVLFGPEVASQSQTPARTPEFLRQRADEFLQRSKDAERSGLAEPFKGLTTNGRTEPGLFAIRSTGVSTEPVRKATDAFLAALTPALRGKAVFDVNDPEWRKW